MVNKYSRYFTRSLTSLIRQDDIVAVLQKYSSIHESLVGYHFPSHSYILASIFMRQLPKAYTMVETSYLEVKCPASKHIVKVESEPDHIEDIVDTILSACPHCTESQAYEVFVRTGSLFMTIALLQKEPRTKNSSNPLETLSNLKSKSYHDLPTLQRDIMYHCQPGKKRSAYSTELVTYLQNYYNIDLLYKTLAWGHLSDFLKILYQSSQSEALQHDNYVEKVVNPIENVTAIPLPTVTDDGTVVYESSYTDPLKDLEMDVKPLFSDYTIPESTMSNIRLVDNLISQLNVTKRTESLLKERLCVVKLSIALQVENDNMILLRTSHYGYVKKYIEQLQKIDSSVYVVSDKPQVINDRAGWLMFLEHTHAQEEFTKEVRVRSLPDDLPAILAHAEISIEGKRVTLTNLPKSLNNMQRKECNKLLERLMGPWKSSLCVTPLRLQDYDYKELLIKANVSFSTEYDPLVIENHMQICLERNVTPVGRALAQEAVDSLLKELDIECGMSLLLYNEYSVYTSLQNDHSFAEIKKLINAGFTLIKDKKYDR